MEPVKLCKRGHERTPENVRTNGGCKECAREQSRLRAKKEYLKNPGKIKERSKKYRLCHPEKVKDMCRSWRQDNKAKVNKYSREWNHNNHHKVHHSKILAIRELKASYLSELLGLNVSAVTPELMELKRKQLKLTRFVRKAKKLKEDENGNIPHNA